MKQIIQSINYMIMNPNQTDSDSRYERGNIELPPPWLPYPEEPPPAYSSVVVDSPAPSNESFTNEAFNAEHDVTFNNASAVAVFTAAASTPSQSAKEPKSDQLPLQIISGSTSKPEDGGDAARQRSYSDGSNAESGTGSDSPMGESPWMMILCMIVNPVACLGVTLCFVLDLKPKIKNKICCLFLIILTCSMIGLIVFSQLNNEKTICERGEYLQIHGLPNNTSKLDRIDVMSLNASCLPCPAGTYTDRPITLPDNFFLNEEIIAKKYPKLRLGRCLTCRLGSWTISDDRLQCHKCPKGMYGPDPAVYPFGCKPCADKQTTLKVGEEICRICDGPESEIKWTKKTCHCPAGYMDGPMYYPDEIGLLQTDPYNSCDKRRTIKNDACDGANQFCGPHGEDFHWCNIKKNVGSNASEVVGWEYCCASGSCEKDNDKGEIGCWVDDAKSMWKRCEYNGLQDHDWDPLITLLSVLSGPTLALVSVLALCLWLKFCKRKNEVESE